MNSKLKSGLILIFTILLVLMNYPMLDVPFSFLGKIPGVLIYLLIVWVGIIIVMRFIFLKSDKN